MFLDKKSPCTIGVFEKKEGKRCPLQKDGVKFDSSFKSRLFCTQAKIIALEREESGIIFPIYLPASPSSMHRDAQVVTRALVHNDG